MIRRVVGVGGGGGGVVGKGLIGTLWTEKWRDLIR